MGHHIRQKIVLRYAAWCKGMGDAHKYRLYAAQCVETAGRTRNDKFWQSMLELATAYERLADHAE